MGFGDFCLEPKIWNPQLDAVSLELVPNHPGVFVWQ